MTVSLSLAALALPAAAESKAAESAVFGGGCFWCMEAVFQLVPGVLGVENGYAGGAKPNPSYEEVCRGDTGYIEVVRIRYDPARVGYRELLRVFFSSHDPSSIDRQGADAGPQYRSAVFWADETQRRILAEEIAAVEKERRIKVVTEARPLAAQPFWRAEEYHQDYFRKHPDQAYCRVVIKPKVDHYLQTRPAGQAAGR